MPKDKWSAPVFSMWYMVCLAGLVSACSPQDIEPLTFENAVIRQPVPGTSKSVGYLTISNNTQSPIVLTEAESDAAGAVEMHETREVDGLMRMRLLSELHVSPGAELVLAPGGKHLMLFRLQSLDVGRHVQVTFTDAAGVTYAHDFEVVPVGYQP